MILTCFCAKQLLWQLIFLTIAGYCLSAALSEQERERAANVNANNNANSNANLRNLTNPNAELVKVVSGTKVKRFDRLTVPLGGGPVAQHQPLYVGYSYVTVVPHWQAFAKMQGAGEAAVEGMITFQQLPYNTDIKVTINITGLPVGKHALHVHTFGDLNEGCKSTGGQFPNNFIGNVDTKDDGSISAAFRSVYLNLFGYNGIIGRSIVIHEKPIDLNTALNAEVFSSALQAMPDALAYQNEENSVGPIIACGVISITSTNAPAMTPQM